MKDFKLDRTVITDEVFRIIQDGGYIAITPSKHVGLYNEDGVFMDWLA